LKRNSSLSQNWPLGLDICVKLIELDFMTKCALFMVTILYNQLAVNWIVSVTQFGKAMLSGTSTWHQIWPIYSLNHVVTSVCQWRKLQPGMTGTFMRIEFCSECVMKLLLSYNFMSKKLCAFCLTIDLIAFHCRYSACSSEDTRSRMRDKVSVNTIHLALYMYSQNVTLMQTQKFSLRSGV
jgi:hypothetical protein